MKRAIQTIAAILLLGVAATGCAGLSVFSSTHTHHHKSEGYEKEIQGIERRLDALESNAGATDDDRAPVASESSR